MNWIGDHIMKPYLDVCKQAAEDDQVFNVFKSLPAYRKILEHTSKQNGLYYLNHIKEDNPDLLDAVKLWQNDKIGSPAVFQYGRYIASPTTLQYIYVLSELIKQFGSLSGWRICEIGGGYGGQCKIIKDVFYCDYTIIDLYDPVLLQKRYLKEFDIVANHETPNTYELNEYDLVISNYALSEITEPLQSKYIQDICCKSKHGYLTCNYQLPLESLPEHKVTPDIECEKQSNYIVIW